MAAENGDTKVRFELWKVLAFLCFIFAICFGYLFNALATGKAERLATNMAVHEQLTTLKLNYGYILQGITDLKSGQQAVVVALDAHIKASASSDRVKDWNDPGKRTLRGRE